MGYYLELQNQAKKKSGTIEDAGSLLGMKSSGTQKQYSQSTGSSFGTTAPKTTAAGSTYELYKDIASQQNNTGGMQQSKTGSSISGNMLTRGAGMNMYNPSQVYETNGFSSRIASGLDRASGNTGGASSSEFVVPDLGSAEEPKNTYTGPTFEDLRQAEYDRIYKNWQSQANAEYNRAAEAAEAFALKKKGQANTRRATMEKYVPETLRAMGLANNGLAADALLGLDANYTNYILQALAAEEEAKNEAAYNRSATMRNADNQMAQWRLEDLATKEGAYAELMRLAAEGSVGEEYLTNYGGFYGFDEENMTSVYDIYKEAAARQDAQKTEAEKSTISELLASAATGNWSEAYLLEQGKYVGLSESGMATLQNMYASQVAEGQNQAFSAYKKQLNSETVDSIVGTIYENASLDYAAGALSDDQFKKIEDAYKIIVTLDGAEQKAALNALFNGNATAQTGAVNPWENYTVLQVTNYQDVVDGLNGGTRYTEDEIAAAVRNGELDEDLADEIRQMQEWYVLKDKGQIDNATLTAALKGDTSALGAIATVKNAKQIAAQATGKNTSVFGKIVNVNSKEFKSSNFGTYQDTGKSDSGQEKYLSQLVADAKAGKIEVGQVVNVNYGTSWENGAYIYVGNGVFVCSKQRVERFGNQYVPDGYAANYVGTVGKK